MGHRAWWPGHADRAVKLPPAGRHREPSELQTADRRR